MPESVIPLSEHFRNRGENLYTSVVALFPTQISIPQWWTCPTQIPITMWWPCPLYKFLYFRGGPVHYTNAYTCVVVLFYIQIPIPL